MPLRWRLGKWKAPRQRINDEVSFCWLSNRCSRDGKVLYRGEWAADRVHGKGEVFWSNGQLRYQGEFKDGLKHGNGTQWTEGGTLDFEGAFVDDKRADGKAFAPDGAGIEHKTPEKKPEKKAPVKGDPKEPSQNGQKTKDACCTTF